MDAKQFDSKKCPKADNTYQTFFLAGYPSLKVCKRFAWDSLICPVPETKQFLLCSPIPYILTRIRDCQLGLICIME